MAVGRSGKHKRAAGKRREPHGSGTQVERFEQLASRQGRATGDEDHSWFLDKRPIFRFVLIFGVLLGGFHAFFYLWLSKHPVFDSYLEVNAAISTVFLRCFGESAKTTGAAIVSPNFSMEIRHGCDALQASAFFIAAVLASPGRVALLSRVPCLVVGTVLLLGINLVRIISLYYTGVYFPKAFDIVHIDLWQALFIFLPILFWVLWSRWASRTATVSPDVRV